MQYWQIAAGSESRDYSDDFLRYGLAFVGGQGPIATMKQVSLGDRIILKRGVTAILAVGVVVERDREWRGDVSEGADHKWSWLRDYDGWDLPAYCHVEWHREPEPRSAEGLVRGTLKRVHHGPLQAIAEEILRSTPSHPFLPAPQIAGDPELTDDEMLGYLIHAGLRPATAEELTATLRRIRLLARYYYDHCQWEDIREHEARTFLIIPFLLALGWSEQQIKIELGVPGGRIDIACFVRPFRRQQESKQPNNADCALILESKGFSQGLDYAHSQGKAYATAFPSCQVVLTSNGYCYKAYKRRADGASFEEAPAAYLNLLKPQRRYPRGADNVGGALNLLSFLMPRAQAADPPERP